MGELPLEMILELLDVDLVKYDELCIKHPELPLRKGPIQLELDFDGAFNETLRGVYGDVGRALASSDLAETIAHRLGIDLKRTCSACQGQGKWMGLQTWHECKSCNGTGRGT